MPWQLDVSVLASPGRTTLFYRKLCWTLPQSGSLPGRYPLQREVWLSMLQVFLSPREDLSCLLPSLFSSKKIENSVALLRHLPVTIYGDPIVQWVTGAIWSLLMVGQSPWAFFKGHSKATGTISDSASWGGLCGWSLIQTKNTDKWLEAILGLQETFIGVISYNSYNYTEWWVRGALPLFFGNHR